MIAADPSQALPHLLLAAATALLAVGVLRLLATGLLLVVARRAPRSARPTAARWAVRLSPRVVRPLVVAALGTAVGLASSGAASAATTAPPRPAAGGSAPALPPAAWGAAGTRDLGAPPADGDLPPAGWVAPPPPRPTVPTHLVTSTPQRAAEHGIAPGVMASAGQAAGVVVRRGDTLWSLAARQLGPGATDADVAAAWPRWWHANRTVVGDDPDLLLPGTRLVAPAAGQVVTR